MGFNVYVDVDLKMKENNTLLWINSFTLILFYIAVIVILRTVLCCVQEFWQKQVNQSFCSGAEASRLFN